MPIKNSFYRLSSVNIPEFAVLIWYGFNATFPEFRSALYTINTDTKNLEFIEQLQTTNRTILANQSPNLYHGYRPQVAYTSSGSIRVIMSQPDDPLQIGWMSWDPVSGDKEVIFGESDLYKFFAQPTPVVVGTDVYLVEFVPDFIIGTPLATDKYIIKVKKTDPSFSSVSLVASLDRTVIDVFGAVGTSSPNPTLFINTWKIGNNIMGEYQVSYVGFPTQDRSYYLDVTGGISDDASIPSLVFPEVGFGGFTYKGAFTPYSMENGTDSNLFSMDSNFFLSGGGDPLLKQVNTVDLDVTYEDLWSGIPPYSIPSGSPTQRTTQSMQNYKDSLLGVFYTNRLVNDEEGRAFIISDKQGTTGELYTIESAPFDRNLTGISGLTLRGVFFLP